MLVPKWFRVVDKGDAPHVPPGATVIVVARKLLIVGLILLLIVLIIPTGIGMAMGACPECASAGVPMLGTACAILVATILILGMMVITRLTSYGARPPGRVVVRGLERPPRSS